MVMFIELIVHWRQRSADNKGWFTLNATGFNLRCEIHEQKSADP